MLKIQLYYFSNGGIDSIKEIKDIFYFFSCSPKNPVTSISTILCCIRNTVNIWPLNFDLFSHPQTTNREKTATHPHSILAMAQGMVQVQALVDQETLDLTTTMEGHFLPWVLMGPWVWDPMGPWVWDQMGPWVWDQAVAQDQEVRTLMVRDS